MSKPSFTEIMKSNAASAAYRVAATQSVNVIKSAILTVMRNKGADGGSVQAFSAFLDTEYGSAMIGFAVGSGLRYIPQLGDDPRIVRLAEELSIGGMATFGNAVVGEAMQHVLPALTEILKSLPKEEEASNVRIIESASTKKLEEALEEEETEAKEETASPKTARA